MNDAPSQPPDEAAPRASRYEVLAKIASGGMATVFVGRTRGAVGFSRLVAIKRPHGFVSRDRGMQSGLELEARVASKIHHPHVVSILDVELVGDELSLILDYVEGGTLQDLYAHAKKSGVPLRTGVAVRIVLDTASGLHAAHALRDGAGAPVGIIHRDVSPQNILVGIDGQSRLTDFGIAKIANQIEHTATGVLKGKLGYLPPEYVVSREFDAQSDQYALAVVAWETLTGSRMFGGYNDGEVMRQIACGAAPTVSSACPDLEPLDATFARALSRNPGERFESVAAFAEELEARAREHGWVAPHGEVGALVEAAVGDKVRQRRSAIESSSAPSVSSSSMRTELQARDAGSPSPRRLELPRPRTPMPRDAMATRSLPAEVLLPLPVPPPLALALALPAAAVPTATQDGPSPALAETRQVQIATPDGPPTQSIPSALLGAEMEPQPEPRASAAPPPPSVRRWWPVAPVVVVAALTGFGITRGILAPRQVEAPALPSASQSAVAVMVETAPGDDAAVPATTPPGTAEDPSLAVPPGFIGALPPQPPPPPPPPLSVLPAQSRPEIHVQPGRSQQRSRRPTSPAADVRGASSAIPARAPPNPYAL